MINLAKWFKISPDAFYTQDVPSIVGEIKHWMVSTALCIITKVWVSLKRCWTNIAFTQCRLRIRPINQWLPCLDWKQLQTKTSTALRWLHMTLQPSVVMRRSLLAYIRITVFIVSVHFSASHLSDFVQHSSRPKRRPRLMLAAQRLENCHWPLRRMALWVKSL